VSGYGPINLKSIFSFKFLLQSYFISAPNSYALKNGVGEVIGLTPLGHGGQHV